MRVWEEKMVQKGFTAEEVILELKEVETHQR